ncbi:MAG TPA: AI-2E family transporter [Casimicrobiaceae bacterium]|nr:AI-2E family transporter [Casimicrobiaceae bacterium]
MEPAFRTDKLLALVALALIIVGCYLVLQPFLTALLWAMILAVTLWPLQVRLAARMRRSFAALITVFVIMVVFIAPFAIVFSELADNSAQFSSWLKGALERGPPDPPAWVAGLPFVGERAAAYWGTFAHDTTKLFAELRRLLEPAHGALVAGGATFLGGLLQLVLSLLIAFFLLRDGDKLARRVQFAAERLASERGLRLANSAGLTVRGVVVGILGTALAQGVLAGLGFWIAGVHAAALLGFVTFLLSPVPVGPPLVWLPVAFFLFQQGQVGWGIFVLIWGALVVSSIDNVIKPLIISRGSDLPFILVFLGILGGVVAFGFIGVFLGPVLLALGYALVTEWSEEKAVIVSS